MDVLPPMILLHANGYKALAAPRSNDLRLAVVELDGKMVRLGERDLKSEDDMKLKPGNRRKT
jgi:hypothetical protein